MYYNLSKSKKPQKKSTSQVSHPFDKKQFIMIIGILLISVLIAFGAAKIIEQFTHSSKSTEPDANTTVDANSDINLAFLQLESNQQNLIYSPLSIKNGLALLNAGAAGTTKVQIENILGDVVILGKTANIQDKLALANAVFVRDSFSSHISQTYIDNVKKHYGAEVVFDSFGNGDIINKWVKDHTLGLIDQLGFTPRESTEMVLTNALAIQLDWKHQFNTSDTTGETFHTADGQEINATTMVQTANADDIRYYQDDSTTLVALPLEKAGDAELEFVALMPSADLKNYLSSFTLSDLEAKLNASNTADTVKDGVEIHIPKFKFDYELKFKSDLMRLGVTDAFSDSLADFSAMVNKSLYVSDAIHKANIDFSENGIKAAAVTAFAMTLGSALPAPQLQPIIIKFDRPYLFLIRDKNNGAIWFVGTVYQPNLWSDDAATYRL